MLMRVLRWRLMPHGERDFATASRTNKKTMSVIDHAGTKRLAIHPSSWTDPMNTIVIYVFCHGEYTFNYDVGSRSSSLWKYHAD
jgi:hypothetical protein